MNERIKVFEDQCWEDVPIDFDYDHLSRIKRVFNKEKFAELIVRECLSKIENEAAQYAEPVWAFELVNDIKEHFGFGNRA